LRIPQQDDYASNALYNAPNGNCSTTYTFIALTKEDTIKAQQFQNAQEMIKNGPRKETHHR